VAALVGIGVSLIVLTPVKAISRTGIIIAFTRINTVLVEQVNDIGL